MLKLKNFKYNYDKKFLFKIREQLYIRRNFFNSKKNSYIDHLKWINKNYKKNIIFIILLKNKKIGYLRYQNKKNYYLISIAIQKKHQKKGFSKQALLKSENFLKNKIIKSKVLIRNKNSLNFFKSCNYKTKRLNQTFVELEKILK
tara:strand:- start:14 stop:448 length:435 start_codon:yes stop_codon:yes gene_type:complete